MFSADDLLHAERRRVGGRVGAPDDDQFGVLQVGIHGHVHLAHGDVRRDHGKGHVAQGTDPQGVGRPEGKEDAGGRRDGDAGWLHEIAQGHVKGAAACVDGGGTSVMTGTVSDGTYSFDYLVDDADAGNSDCASFDVTGTATLNSDLDEMTIEFAGTFCGETAAGAYGEVSGTFTKQ